MDEVSIARYIANTFEGVEAVTASRENDAPEVAWGDSFFFYDPRGNLDAQRKFPFATIVTKDYGDFDCASNLNRSGIFRLNIGVSKETYASLFPDDRNYDYATLNELIPHPVYGKMFWVSVLNPDELTFEKVKPLLVEAYQLTAKRYPKEV